MGDKPKKKLYVIEPKKLYQTSKEYIMNFLEKNPEIESAKQLKKLFPDMSYNTLYAYFRDFSKKSELLQYIPHIHRVLHCLAYKYVVQKHVSVKELQSIEILGKLVEEYKYLIEEKPKNDE